MGNRTIKVETLTRVEGEGGLYVRLNRGLWMKSGWKYTSRRGCSKQC
ncbi:MAG: hypothetical protein R3C11_00075 [Planctomycetaceae bacterium]